MSTHPLRKAQWDRIGEAARHLPERKQIKERQCSE